MNQIINPDQNQKPFLEYDGKLGELYGVFLKNLGLSMVTMGIYRFWGITNMRKYVWSRMRFQGERFEYTGTGGELFAGFLIVFGALYGASIAVGIIGVIFTLLHLQDIAILLQIAFGVVLVTVICGLPYSALRYRLNRTVWRGIRGGMTGSRFGAPFRFGALMLLYGLIAIFTLYQMIPWVTVRVAERLINASGFGSEQFHFSGSARRLYGVFVVAFLGIAVLAAVLVTVMIVLGGRALFSDAAPEQMRIGAIFLFIALYLVFIFGAQLIQGVYFAHVVRHVMGNTTLGSQLRFGSTITGRNVTWLILGNLLITIFTFGLGYPVTLQRNLKLAVRTLKVEGVIDVEQLGQNSQITPFTGDGALSVFDGGFI